MEQIDSEAPIEEDFAVPQQFLARLQAGTAAERSTIQIQPFQEALQLCEELSPQHEQIVATGASELSRGAKTAPLIESVVSIVRPMDVRGLLDNREQAQIRSNALDESADYIKLDESTAAVLKPFAEKMHAELSKLSPTTWSTRTFLSR